MININWTMFWEVVNFLVLMWLLTRYLYKPLTEMLDKRSEKIKSDLASAENSKQDAQKLKAKYEAELGKAREKAQVIIEEAERRGKEHAEEIINKAKKEASRIQERNLEEISRAKEEAMKQLKQEVASISLLVASKYMQEQIKKGQQEKLIEKYINSLDRGKMGEVK